MMAEFAVRAVRNLWLISCALLLVVGCGNSGEPQSDVPRYPGATEVESLDHPGVAGFGGGELVQWTTHDGYDEVLEFYMNALAGQEFAVISHTSDLGRQTALSIQRERSAVTVAIQEFRDEGRVNITVIRLQV